MSTGVDFFLLQADFLAWINKVKEIYLCLLYYFGDLGSLTPEDYLQQIKKRFRSKITGLCYVSIIKFLQDHFLTVYLSICPDTGNLL
jgi:hypothetical protein